MRLLLPLTADDNGPKYDTLHSELRRLVSAEYNTRHQFIIRRGSSGYGIWPTLKPRPTPEILLLVLTI
jgi:hypothetical protein